MACYLPNVTEQRRSPHDGEATGSTELLEMRANDVPLEQFVRAGGFLGFTPAEMFQGAR